MKKPPLNLSDRLLEIGKKCAANLQEPWRSVTTLTCSMTNAGCLIRLPRRPNRAIAQPAAGLFDPNS